jgi:tetratricopeptide (TPR) repeat protein
MKARKLSNPFPGLRTFETDENHLFFGREGQSDELLARLQRTRFLAVVGTSGSGKSSLVRAGLLPALYGGMMAGAGSGWRIAIIRPGHSPLGNLACALSERDVLPEAAGGLGGAEGVAVIEATLRRGALGLLDAVRQSRLEEHENLLIVVDQFEELFRFRATTMQAGAEDEAAAFIKLLLEASAQRDVPVYVLLTMRSDFLGDCSQFQGLPEAINDGQYLIPRLTRDDRRQAITGPVAVSRGRITEPLVSRLLNDVGDNPDQLPILQHALMRTWDYWVGARSADEPLGIEHYEAIGTMRDALSRHADEAWDELPDDRSRKLAELLFKALTERGADNREIRRPTRLREICEITGASEEEVTAVINIFRRAGRSFLMPPAGVTLTGDTFIDISHESLIRNWERLKDWVRDEAEAARIYRRLAGAATDYREGAGGLLDDVTLQYVLKWRDRYSPNRAWGVRYQQDFDAAMAFLEESKAAHEAAVAERERQREEKLARERRELEQAQKFAEHQRRAAHRMRRLTVAMLCVSLLALGAAGGAVYAYVMARKAKVANDKFRDAVADAQRGDESDALAMLGEAAEEYKALHNREAVADTMVQLGNIIFNRAHTRFLMEKGDLQGKAVTTDLAKLTSTLDAAAEIYASPEINSPHKAGAALFTLGTMLMKFTKDQSEGRALSADAVAKMLEAAHLDRPVPFLAIKPEAPGVNPLDTRKDLRTEIKAEATERYRRALDYYRQEFEGGGQKEDSDWQEQARQGMRKAAYQLGEFHLNEANYLLDEADDPDSTPVPPAIIKQHRQQSVHYFEELLKLSESDTGDAELARLLVWLGGLRHELGEQQAAEAYFQKVSEAYRKKETAGVAEAHGWIADIAEQAGQTDVAAIFYAKALDAYRAGDDPLSQAETLYSLGRVHEASSATFEKAVGFYRQSIEMFRLSLERGKQTTTAPEKPLHVGSLAEDIDDFTLALDSYRLAITFSRRDDEPGSKRDRARAYREIGSIFSVQSQPRQALDSYRLSYELYDELSKLELDVIADEAETEAARLSRIITALSSALRQKPPTPRQ